VPGDGPILLAHRPYDPTPDAVTQRRHQSGIAPIPSAPITARDGSRAPNPSTLAPTPH
jgi:hypothetical protein